MVKLCKSNTKFCVVFNQDFSAFSLDVDQKVWSFSKCVHVSDNALGPSIDCCAFSPCETYFGVNFDKNILIYSTLTWNVLLSSSAERKGCTLQFFPKSKNLLLADKSGCVSFYSFNNGNLKKSGLSLGHNSMLTSALVSKDEKYIITCDRDEKIRVTNYPNAYNIESYCLGHEMFISCVAFLPSDPRIIVSGSGDGTIKFWNFEAGKEIATFNCNDTESDSKTVVSAIATCELNNISIIGISEYKSSKIRILQVEGDLNTNLIVNCVEVLNLTSLPQDIIFDGETLVCLVLNENEPLFFWSKDKYNLNILKNRYKSVNLQLLENRTKLSKTSDDISVLFKREVDNLQEYEQRKRARLQKTGRTS